METVKRFRLAMTKNGSCWPMFTGEQFVLDGALFQEHPEGELTRAADTVRLQDSERYAWKNAREIDAERITFRTALEQITRIGLLGVDTYPECYRRMRAIAVGALSGEHSAVSASGEP